MSDLFVITLEDTVIETALLDLPQPMVQAVEQCHALLPDSPRLELRETDLCLVVNLGKLLLHISGDMLVADRIIYIPLLIISCSAE